MAAQRKMLQSLGFMPPGVASAIGALTLNIAGTWAALGFVPLEAKTISKVRIFMNAVSGGLASTDITVDLYSDTTGTGPNAGLESRNTITTALAAGAWGEWTGFTTALTAGTQYWLVVKNVNGTPASNSIQLLWGAANQLPIVPAGNSVNYGFGRRSTSNSGAAWSSNAVAAGAMFRIEYSDGTFDGFPISNCTFGATDMVYSAREVGFKLTTPPGPSLQVRTLAFCVKNSGTPTGDLRARLYTGSTSTPTLAATSNSIAKANVTTTGVVYTFTFPSTVTVTAGTVLRGTLGETTQSDTSTNRYQTVEYTFDSNANSVAMMPIEGTCGKTYTTDGTTFTDTTNILVPFALGLDSDGEFAGGGGQPLVGVSPLIRVRGAA